MRAIPDEIYGELTVSFEHRNRVGTWNYAESGKTDNPEPVTAYQIKVYGESDTLIHTEPLTGKTWTYLEAQEIADSGLGRLNNHLRVEIRTFDGDLVEAFRMIE